MKKFIAALLAAATLTAVSIPAFAEEPEIAEPTPAVQELEPAAAKEESPAPAPVEEKAEEAKEEAAEEIPAETPETPEISADEAKEILGSDEVKNALREAGLDEDEIEEVIENPETEIIYITQEEFEQMRRDYAMTAFSTSLEMLKEGAMYMLLIPAVPIMFFIPFVGPLTCGVILAAPVLLIGGLGSLIASPVVSVILYKGYKLPPNYEIRN